MGFDPLLFIHRYAAQEILLYGLAAFFCIWWSGLWLVHVVSISYAKYKMHRGPKIRLRSEYAKLVEPVPAASTIENATSDYQIQTTPSTSTEYPPVSIIKPLCGIDENLATNLDTFFHLEYPIYELLFCVHNDEDPAAPIVRTLLAKYPHVDAHLFVGGEDVGVNPKVNNMMPAYRASKYELIMISDAGIYMPSNALFDLVHALKPNTAIVTQVPFTYGAKGFAAALENVFFGTMHARMYLIADFFSIVCSTGMSSLMRKCALEAEGGLSAFGCYLAEDYFFAYSFVKRGWKCGVASQPAIQNHVPEIGRFTDRLCRWGRLRQAMMPQTIILEPLQDCMISGAVGAWAFAFLLGWNALILFLVHVLVWMLLDYLMLNIIQHDQLSMSKFEYVVVWLYRELSAFPMVLRALSQHTITWRQGEYRLEWGGKATRIIPTTQNVEATPPSEKIEPSPLETPTSAPAVVSTAEMPTKHLSMNRCATQETMPTMETIFAKINYRLPMLA